MHGQNKKIVGLKDRTRKILLYLCRMPLNAKKVLIILFILFGTIIPELNSHVKEKPIAENSSNLQHARIFYFEIGTQESGYSNSEPIINIILNLFSKQIKSGNQLPVFISMRNKSAHHYISPDYQSTIFFLLSFFTTRKMMFPFHGFY